MNFITNKDKPSDLADSKKPDNFLNKRLFFFTDFWGANTPTVLTKINWKKVAGSWNSASGNCLFKFPEGGFPKRVNETSTWNECNLR